MPVGLGCTMHALGRGMREIDRQVLYSAAWLDDPRPNIARIALVRAPDPGSQPLPLVAPAGWCRAPQPRDSAAPM
jgi:hypothetical protein